MKRHLITTARGALAGLLATGAARLVALPAEDCDLPGLGCLPIALVAAIAALLAAIAVGWLVAWALRLPRPLLVGIVGPFAMFGLTWAVGITAEVVGIDIPNGDVWWWFFGLTPLAYTLLALVATWSLAQRQRVTEPGTRE